VTFPLTSLTSLELKILMPEYLSGSYCINSNTLFVIKSLISCCYDFLKGFPRVVIIPSCHRFIDNSILACSLLIMNAMEVLIPLLIVVMNCSSKSLSIGHFQLQLPLRIVVAGHILLPNPGGHP
jgi:hypothetical protein